MSSYNSNLKTWGSQGAEYPDSYNYVEGEQPVDAWDNFLTYNLIQDINHLISLTNNRIESGVSTSNPSSPEPGELSHRTDSPDGTGKEELYQYDGTNATWDRLLKAGGDTMSGVLDMGGYSIKDGKGELSLDSKVSIDGGSLHQDWFSKFEGGTVASGTAVPLRTVNLADSSTLYVTEAHLSEDGFTSPAAGGVDLAIVADDGTTQTVLSGDGSTLHDQETGLPVASYTNSSGGAQTVMLALDNGEYNSGSGADQRAFGGFIARIA